MGVVHDAIEESVGDGRIRDVVVPGLDGQLTGHDCRAGAVSVLEDLEHVAALLLAKRREAPVVEHEDVDLREPTQEARVRTVGMGERELFEEPRHPSIGHAIAATTRPLATTLVSVLIEPGLKATARP